MLGLARLADEDVEDEGDEEKQTQDADAQMLLLNGDHFGVNAALFRAEKFEMNEGVGDFFVVVANDELN